ncbi:ubiquitin carboxyl-terminal hydrolase 25-like [Watersipora subatra]|uniref:ubiquitin carboxyl-terminal hydrolase 25-like n=1 Tax=Watersipora subatra TaxID=2589382 RepID=UPI00355B3B35
MTSKPRPDNDLNDEALASLPSTQGIRNRSNSMETQVETADLSYPKPVTESASGEGDNEELQQAIAASLMNNGSVPSMLGGQITREDQDISRVLEQSIAENKSADSKRNAVWFVNHPNPYERRREDSWPVGLENIGNTCWFNAVIQSLFHVEEFRDLVIRYEPAEALSKENYIAVFMLELGRLFSLMLASERKYLSPTAVIKILRQSFTSSNQGHSSQPSNDQQDVSEFQHKLLDWLEEAFQYKAGATHNYDKQAGVGNSPQAMDVDDTASVAQAKNESNEMVKLFYGEVRTLGFNAGEPYTTLTHFGQWPLYVAGYSDIHESLEAGLAKEDIETSNSAQTSTQEQWFTRLPPLLTFELSRFSYNAMQSQAEKLHNKFSFPQILYLDRYLEENKEEVRDKRGRLWQQKATLESTEAKLYKYTHFGQGEQKYPLYDILNYTLDFTTSGPDVQSAEQSSSPSSSEPQPKNVSREELMALKGCLSRWKEEVKAEIAQYESEIAHLKHDISQAYDQEHLKQHKYNLHAVLVHDGEALSGHYWSYIYNRESGLWIKFNDVCVVESSWEEVIKESEGGYGKASAYCLIYTRATTSRRQSAHADNPSVCRPSGQDFPSKEDALLSLPAALKYYVDNDNEALQKELTQWDLGKSAIFTTRDTYSSADIMPPMDIEPRGPQLQPCIKTDVNDLANSHAHSIYSMTRKKLLELLRDPESAISWRYKTEMLVEHCYGRCRSFSEDQKCRDALDTRAHFIVYLLMVYGSSVNPNAVKALIADQISRLKQMSDIDGWAYVQNEAGRTAQKYWEDNEKGFQSNYGDWHREYNAFRVVLSLFVEGLTLFLSERYEDALPYLHEAYTRNVLLINSATKTNQQTCNSAMKYLNENLLLKVRHLCIQRFNEMALNQFENEEDYATPLKVMLTHVLPILDTMQTENGSSQDSADLVGCVKDQWVKLLIEDNMEDRRMECLKDFIGQLFEAAISPAPTVEEWQPPLDLRSRCKQAMKKYELLK